MDVTSKESIQNGVEVVQEADGRLDILVNKYDTDNFLDSPNR